MKVACSPLRRHTSFTIERNVTMASAWASGPSGSKVNSNWLGPNSASMERTGRSSPWAARRRSSMTSSRMS